MNVVSFILTKKKFCFEFLLSFFALFIIIVYINYAFCIIYLHFPLIKTSVSKLLIQMCENTNLCVSESAAFYVKRKSVFVSF